MPAYYAPAIVTPAIPEGTTAIDPDTGEEFAVASRIECTGTDPIPGGTYVYEESESRFLVTTPEPLSPVPDGWMEA